MLPPVPPTTKRKYWTLSYKAAKLISSKGEFEVFQATKKTPSIIRVPEYKYHHSHWLHAGDGEREFALVPAAGSMSNSRLYVTMPFDMIKTTQVDLGDSFYSFNDGQLQPLEVQDDDWRGATNTIRDNYAFGFSVAIPSEFAAHKIREHGDGLIDSERYKEQIETETYRYLIAFSVNDEPYKIDVTFNYRIKGYPQTGLGIFP